MPTVSAGGTPLPAIAPSAASASRQMPAMDSRFEALLAPVAAELGKGGSKSAQPAQARPTEPNSPAIQPVEAAAGDGAAEQPTQVDATLNKPRDIGGSIVPSLATAPGGAIPTPPRSDVPTPVRPGSQATVGPKTAAVTVPANAMQGHNESAPALDDALNPSPVSHDVTPQSNGQLATKAGGHKEADAQTTGIASPQISVAAASSAAAAMPASSPADSPEAVSPAISATPVEAPAGKHASARRQADAAKDPQVAASATLPGVTASSPVVPQPDAANSAPAPSVAAAIGAHLTLKSLSDVANSEPEASTQTAGAGPPSAHIFAMQQPGVANSAAMINPAAVAPGAQILAAVQPDERNSTAVTSARPVAAMRASTHVAALPALDAGDLQPDTAPVPANTGRPGLAATLPASDGSNTASTAQSQPHDARPDPIASPLYTAGVATPTVATDASPSAPPAAPPTGTATQQVAMHIAQSLSDGSKTVTVELHPAELGRVEIHFSFHSDGMNVRLTVDRPETFDAFSHDRSGLEQQLAQAGVHLGGGGLDLRLGQPPPDQTGSYSSGRIPRVTMPTPQSEATPATLWVSNSLLDILA
jgi:flagellar hook-length control protein FliK